METTNGNEEGNEIGLLIRQNQKNQNTTNLQKCVLFFVFFIIYSDVKLVFHSSYEASLVDSFLLLTQTCSYI